MTINQIEVRAVAERHDTHAHQLAREILQLPTQQLPSLAEMDALHPFTLHTAQLYHLSGNLSTSQLHQLSQQLLVDPVIQEAHIFPATHLTETPQAHIVDVFFHMGVTDTLAESVLEGAQMLGIAELTSVETGQRYFLDQRLSAEEARIVAQALLYNPVIQNYHLYPANQPPPQYASSESQAGSTPEAAARSIPICDMDDEQLLEVSRAGLLSLNLDELHVIQQHYRQLHREPTDVELETLAQTWSEHCSHKTFKATINYREMDDTGHVLESETIQGLLKRYIMQATEKIQPAWLVSAFSDNAGIIRFSDTHDLAFKVETHNHPSAIEPFGGANTGVGGVIRDVMGVSAQPIACTDILCFGPLDTAMDELPEGILSPRRIASGVVSGVRDYGNKMGIPTVNGAILYDPGYIYNPLVFCGCLGLLPHGSHPNKVQPGDQIVVLGGRTGRDGIHGATFSSGEMSSEINAQAGAAVQIGAPITEKKVADVIIQARDHQLYHAITDCGAGGFSSAIGEMAEHTGARVELSLAPLKYQGLAPWEIWLSEAQERMVLAVPLMHIEELADICAIEEVEMSIIGSFTDDRHLTLTYQDEVVAEIAMDFLHDGRPNRTLEAVWYSRSRALPARAAASGQDILAGSYGPTLLALLRHPSIGSKEEVVRRYDHEVQSATVGKPLVGRAGNGPGDAAVLLPIPSDLTAPAHKGIVLSNGVNPLYGKIDPYAMAMNAVDEALRNLTAVGGDIRHAAILDNFCWGNPTDPEQLGMLVRAVKGCHDAAVGFGTPFISGKDSLNNEYRADGRRLPVIPTLLISAVGVIDDAAHTIDMALKTTGNLLYLIGTTQNELAGSHLAEVIDPDSFSQFFSETSVPSVNLAHAYATMQALGEAIRQGLVRSCHDLSEGGLAVAAAEMALAGLQGASIDIEHITLENAVRSHPAAIDAIRLFSESASRFLVEIAPEQLGAFESHMRIRSVEDITYVGVVTVTGRFIVRAGTQELLNLSVEELQQAWKGGMA